MTIKIPILFYDKSTKKSSVTIDVTELAKNSIKKRFSQNESVKLTQDYDELKNAGLRGLLQIIHQSGSSGDVMHKIMPQEWVKKHLYRLFINNPGNIVKEYNPERDIVITVTKDGLINKDDINKIYDAMKARVGIMIGGGDSHARDLQYKHERLALNEQIKSGTPMYGECLGHQMLSLLIPDKYGSTGVDGGYFEILTTKVVTTQEGKKHPVFSRFGTGFITMVGNEYHVSVMDSKSDIRPAGVVLTRNAVTGYPTGYQIDAEIKGQILSFQYHPYHPIAISSTQKKMYRIPHSSTADRHAMDFSISANRAHPLQIDVAQYLLKNYSKLHPKYGIMERHLKLLFSPDITAQCLEVDFYGPVFQYFADKRLQRL